MAVFSTSAGSSQLAFSSPSIVNRIKSMVAFCNTLGQKLTGIRVVDYAAYQNG